MKIYCRTYQEERDTDFCCFCSAICDQHPRLTTSHSGTDLDVKIRDVKVFDVTEINIEKENIPKHILVDMIADALDQFTTKAVLASVSLKAIVRAEE